MDNLQLRIAVCEDIADDMKRIRTFIEESGGVSSADYFTSGEDFLFAFKAGMYDLIFMDIYMSGISGTRAAEIIRMLDENAVIAFTTSSEGHVLESCRLGALGCLLKPVSEKEVQKTLELARAIRKNRRHLTVRLAGGKERQVFLDTVMYIEHRDHAAEIHTTEGTFVTSQSARLSQLEQLLPQPPFLRCHRSYIVNLD